MHYDPAEKIPNKPSTTCVIVRFKDVRDGAVLVVLSDKGLEKGKLPVPAAMAVGAVQTRLADTNLRCDANIVALKNGNRTRPTPICSAARASVQPPFTRISLMKLWAKC
ncbi:hypothetical protein O9992_11910 [Vibrio lentus]|nr:hypothetical protein [Vibrio lentus]